MDASLEKIADPTLAEMGKNLKEAMKMLAHSQSGQDMVSILQLVQNLMHGDEDEEPQSPR